MFYINDSNDDDNNDGNTDDNNDNIFKRSILDTYSQFKYFILIIILEL